jgi:ribosomal protein S18 acetylase RimI-like enzyme
LSPFHGLRSLAVKTQSIRFRGGVARVAAWHGRPEIASVALLCRGAPSIEAIETLLERLRAGGYTEVITNALAPGASLPLVDSGFEIRGRLHLLSHDFESLSGPTRRTRRSGSSDRSAVLAVDAAAFDEFWRLDDVGLQQAARATPRSHLRVTKGGSVRGYGLFGRAERTGYVQRLAIHPEAQGEGHGLALLTDGLHWMRIRGARSAFVNTQVENERALHLYERAGFHRMPVGLCVLGRQL